MNVVGICVALTLDVSGGTVKGDVKGALVDDEEEEVVVAIDFVVEVDGVVTNAVDCLVMIVVVSVVVVVVPFCS